MSPKARLTLVTDADGPPADAGDETLSFSALYDRHAGYVAGLAGRIVGRNDEVQDIVPDVFLIAHRRMAALRNPPAAKAWLAGDNANHRPFPAGEVIRAFGNFVVAGNLVVGAVVFLILTMIQFIVISKGSERVAEVAARFTLDAMPGKQMSIDAELRAGHIRFFVCARSIRAPRRSSRRRCGMLRARRPPSLQAWEILATASLIAETTVQGGRARAF